jgi:hypothetical protein
MTKEFKNFINNYNTFFDKNNMKSVVLIVHIIINF